MTTIPCERVQHSSHPLHMVASSDESLNTAHEYAKVQMIVLLNYNSPLESPNFNAPRRARTYAPAEGWDELAPVGKWKREFS